MPLNLAEWYEMLKPIWQRNIASPLFDDSPCFFPRWQDFSGPKLQKKKDLDERTMYLNEIYMLFI